LDQAERFRRNGTADPVESLRRFLRTFDAPIVNAGHNVDTTESLSRLFRDVLGLRERFSIVATEFESLAQGRRRAQADRATVFIELRNIYQTIFGTEITVTTNPETNEYGGHGVRFCSACLELLAERLQDRRLNAFANPVVIGGALKAYGGQARPSQGANGPGK
jgi:hypothetical protein